MACVLVLARHTRRCCSLSEGGGSSISACSICMWEAMLGAVGHEKNEFQKLVNFDHVCTIIEPKQCTIYALSMPCTLLHFALALSMRFSQGFCFLFYFLKKICSFHIKLQMNIEGLIGVVIELWTCVARIQGHTVGDGPLEPHD
jgi:hypothetical protein